MIKTRELFVNDRQAIAITSMTRVDKKIYLGLTGGANILAVYDILNDTLEVKENIFPWITDRGYCTKIHNAMGQLPDGSIIMGEGNHFTWDGLPVTVNYFNNELPESMLARKQAQGFPDVKYTDFCLKNLENWNRSQSDSGGRIVRYYPDLERCEIIGFLPNFLYIQSMVIDKKRERGFGHTIPDNHFFMVDFKQNKIYAFGRISDYAHHNMVISPDGVCFGGWLDKADNSLKLFRFDPARGVPEYLNKVILADIGRKVAGNQGIDEWIVTSSGRIFMGTVADSLLFEFHYKEERFELIGKLAEGGRVTSLSEDDNGIIWITADYPHMRILRFDPCKKESAITDLGRVNETYERCYFHTGCWHDGKLYLGETDGFVPSLHIITLDSIQA